MTITETAAWSALLDHHRTLEGQHLRDLFAQDARRGERLSAEGAGLYLDYSKNRVTDNILVSPTAGTHNYAQALTMGDTRVISANTVNNIRFAFNRTTPVEDPAPINGYENLAFIPGQIVGDFLISGYKRFGSDRNTPRSFFQNTVQFADDLTVIRGGHALKRCHQFLIANHQQIDVHESSLFYV